MSVKLRPHHLLCILTYVGKGYSPAFVANYDAIAARISSGEDIVLTPGPDDICAALLKERDPHCVNDNVATRDDLAADTLSQLFDREIRTGDEFHIDARSFSQLRDAFRAGYFAKACSGCAWVSLCRTIADDRFAGTRIQIG